MGVAISALAATTIVVAVAVVVATTGHGLDGLGLGRGFGCLVLGHGLHGRAGHRADGDGLVGVDLGAHPGRKGDVADADGVVQLEIADVDDELVRDRVRRREDREREQRLVDHAVLVGDLAGLALEHDRHVDRQLGGGVDADEVDVDDLVAHRVTLQLLDQRQVTLAVDLEADERVEPGIGGQHLAQLAVVDRERDRLGVEAVEDAGHLGFTTQPA